MPQVYLDDLIPQIVSHDNLSPKLCQPHSEDALIIATDANILMIAPQDYFKNEYAPVDGYPSYRAVFPTEVLGAPLLLNTKLLSDIIDQMPKNPRYSYKDCPDCDGNGGNECDLGHMHDCDDCGGTGEIRGEKIGMSIDYEDHLLRINDTYFNATFWMIVLEISNRLACETVKIRRMHPEKVCYLTVADIELLIMPMAYDKKVLSAKIHAINI